MAAGVLATNVQPKCHSKCCTTRVPFEMRSQIVTSIVKNAHPTPQPWAIAHCKSEEWSKQHFCKMPERQRNLPTSLHRRVCASKSRAHNFSDELTASCLSAGSSQPVCYPLGFWVVCVHPPLVNQQ